MKRLPHLLTSCLVGLSLPFLLGASVPPSRLSVPAAPNHVVEVNVIDRFLQDTGIRKRPKSSERSRSRTRASRNAIPKPPALASVPLPIPKPVDTARATAPEKPPETAENKAASTQAESAPAAETTSEVPKTAPATGPQTAAETNTDATPTPEPEKPEAGKPETATPAPSETAKPTTPETPPPAEPAKDEAAKPPVVEQPATANEPAREAEVPKPLPKPGTDTAEADKGAAPKNEAEENVTAADDAKPDGKQDEDGGKAETEPPPPQPLVKEDPQELQACLADLKAVGAKFEATDPIDEGNGCGIENPIDVAEVLPGVDLGGATMRCKTALTMAHWLKQTAQPALDIAMPGRRITGLVPGSTYQCRLRNSASTGKISEHARGNAYDVSAFKLDNGEVIEMKPRTEDSTLEGAFQRTATAGACLHFTTVLSPGSDATHQDHLHLDILERKGGYRYCR